MPLIFLLLGVFVWNNFLKKEEVGFFENIFNEVVSFGGSLLKKIETEISGINDSYDELFVRIGREEGVNPKILKALAANESYLGRYTGHEPKGDTYGLMHIKISTARDFMPELTRYDLYFSPYSNENQVRAAAKYVKSLIKIFGNNTEKVIKSYNQGQGNTLAGNDFAVDYWDRFNRNLERVG